jgi:hypothetical protein
VHRRPSSSWAGAGVCIISGEACPWLAILGGSSSSLGRARARCLARLRGRLGARARMRALAVVLDCRCVVLCVVCPWWARKQQEERAERRSKESREKSGAKPAKEKGGLSCCTQAHRVLGFLGWAPLVAAAPCCVQDE